MIRRFGRRVVPGKIYRPRPGVYAVLFRHGKVLLTYQPEPDDEVQLPGGGIDPGESPLQALHREVLEETGWTISAARRLGAFRRFAYMPDYDKWAEKLCTIYVARPVQRLGPPSEPGHRALWLSVEEALLAVSSTGERHFLLRALGGWDGERVGQGRLPRSDH